MRILLIGDVVGRGGREAVEAHLPRVREEYSPDIVVLNGDNAAHGFGITEKICKDFYAMGVDCITSGNHVWDQREIISYITRDKNLIRPVNYPHGTPGEGVWSQKLQDGRSIVVIHAQARLFMDDIDDPFRAIDAVLTKTRLGAGGCAILVDFHGEATSETMALAHYLDGRVSAVLGTHTHVPTADCQILPGGTALQCDVGMCGDYNSVIGMDKRVPVERFVRKMPGERMSPASEDTTFRATLIQTDAHSGLCTHIGPVSLGGRIAESVPDF